MQARFIWLSVVFCLLVGVFTYGVSLNYLRSLTQDAAEQDLERISLELFAELDPQRVSLSFLSETRVLQTALSSPTLENIETLRVSLSEARARTGARSISVYRLTDTSTVVSSANRPDTPGYPTIRSSGRLWNFVRQGSLGRSVGYIGEELVYVLAAPVRQNGAVVGAILSSTDLTDIRERWNFLPYSVALVLDDGELALKNVVSVPERETALIVQRDMPLYQWRVELMRDLSPERFIAKLTSAALAFAILALLLIAQIYFERRRKLQSDLEAEREINKRLDDLVAERTQRLTEMNEELKTAQKQLVASEKAAMLGRLSAFISHELNQPLGAQKSFGDNARTFLERSDLAGLSDSLDGIQRTNERMERIIRNLRAYIRGDKTPTEPQDIRPLIRAAVDEVALDRANTRVSIEFSDVPEGEYLAHVGKVRVHQVLVNLLSNACRAAKANPSPRVVLSLNRDAKHIVLTIEDNGPGIEADPGADIFDAFVTTSSHVGMGLGLAIARAFVRLMDGELSLINGKGALGGAIFQVRVLAVSGQSDE